MTKTPRETIREGRWKEFKIKGKMSALGGPKCIKMRKHEQTHGIQGEN